MNLRPARASGTSGYRPLWIGALISSIVGLAFYVATSWFIESDSRERFANHARNAQNTIVARVKSYTDVLRGAASLFRTGETITRSQFTEFASGLGIRENFPAIHSINYAEFVTAAQRPGFERRLRAEQAIYPHLQLPDTIRPNGRELEPRERESYCVVMFDEPSSPHNKAFGLDLHTNPYVEQIMLATRDSGKMMNSGTPILAISAPNQVFLGLRLPVYAPGTELNNVAQRRAAYRGSVGLAFSVPQLMQGVLAEMPVEQVRMTLLDKVIPGPGDPSVSRNGMRILFDSAGELEIFPDEADSDRFTTTLPVNFHGRPWQLTFSTPKYEMYTEFDEFYPKLAAFSGFLGTLLMYALFHALASSRHRALTIAADMTQELRESQSKLQTSNETLRRLGAHADQIKERERKRIAREIHDDLGQNLLALRIDVDILAARTRSSHAHLHARACATLFQIDATIKSVRQIINDLRPNVLDLGLSAAVEWQVKEFRRMSGIACVLREEVRDIAISDQRATAFFRILQESLSNITRHADATEASVELRLSNGSLFMTITDNGNGLADKAHHKVGSFGLVGIEERITMLGGSLSIHGVPGTGTTVCVTAPVDDTHMQRDSSEALSSARLEYDMNSVTAPDTTLENSHPQKLTSVN